VTVARRLLPFVLVLAALAAIVYAGTLGSGPEEVRATDEAVERLVPADGSPVAVRQAEVGVDLAPGWTGVLLINGLEIPEDQLRRVEPQNEVYFQPGEGKEIEAFQAGTIVVEAEIWRSTSETRDDARSVVWRFGVA
jgi:hypothetical protein